MTNAMTMAHDVARSRRDRQRRPAPTRAPAVMLIAVLLTLSACSRDTTEAAPVSAGCGSGPDPCKLLTKQQVEPIVPNNDGGMVAHAGGSLIKGVDSYQCSYINQSGALLTVIWHTAVDDARFEDIRPGSSLISNAQPVEVGERGWLHIGDGRVKVMAVQQRTVIEVELMSGDAAAQAGTVTTLAGMIATGLRADAAQAG